MNNSLFKHINAAYFSATHTTQTVVRTLTETLAQCFEAAVIEHDFTLPEARQQAIEFQPDELAVFAVPVYAGRVPNLLTKYINTLKGNNVLAIAVVVYGNREYDDALIELCDLMRNNDLRVIAAAAFIGEHSFSTTLAAGRPDLNDKLMIVDFAKKVAYKIRENKVCKPITVKGVSYPYRQYYQPVDAQQQKFDMRKVKPVTTEKCTLCGRCVKCCPMGAIDAANPSVVTGICIKCGACVKFCPAQAKMFTDEAYLFHKNQLETMWTRRAEPEIFI